MLQKSYYHAWNPYEILHWMSHKIKIWKKKSFERKKNWYLARYIYKSFLTSFLTFSLAHVQFFDFLVTKQHFHEFWIWIHTYKTFSTLMWSACHKKSYLTNLEVRNLKSAVSALCGCLNFACFEKKWGKVSWIFQNSSIRHITNTFSYDMPTT